MKSLDSLMEECLPAGGVMVKGGRGLYMEVREKASGTVWMSLDPVTKEDFASLELSEEYEHLGFARASMDRALFVHSPDDEMQPVRLRDIGGRTYINVALPGEPQFPTQPQGAVELMVNKAHVLGFEGGRSVSVLRTSAGDFVECIGRADADDKLLLPADAEIVRIDLTEP